MTMQTDPERPRIETSGPLHFAGLSGHYSSETVKDIPAQWQRFGPYIGTVPGQVGRVAYGVCFNPSDDGFDYLTGVEVSDFTHLPEELARLTFPARRYAVFIHLDHVSARGHNPRNLHEMAASLGSRNDQELGLFRAIRRRFQRRLRAGRHRDLDSDTLVRPPHWE